MEKGMTHTDMFLLSVDKHDETFRLVFISLVVHYLGNGNPAFPEVFPIQVNPLNLEFLNQAKNISMVLQISTINIW